jgi:hypothetical protein
MNERKFLPFVHGKMSAVSAQNLKANYRGGISIQHCTVSLSVIELTRKGLNLTKALCGRFPLVLSPGPIIKMSDGSLTDRLPGEISLPFYVPNIVY